MAKNILEFPQAGTLGDNDFLHVIQGGLDKKATFKQLPVATENNNGLMSMDDVYYTSLRKITIKSKEEINLGSFFCKTFTLFDSTSGQAALCLINAFAGCILIPGSGSIFSNTIGNVFLINNTENNTVITIR